MKTISRKINMPRSVIFDLIDDGVYHTFLVTFVETVISAAFDMFYSHSHMKMNSELYSLYVVFTRSVIS